MTEEPTEKNEDINSNEQKNIPQEEFEKNLKTVDLFSYINFNIRENIKKTIILDKIFEKNKSLDQIKKEFEESKFIVWKEKLFYLNIELLNYLYTQRFNRNIIIFDHYNNPVLVENPKNLWLHFNTYYQNICLSYYTQYEDTLENIKNNYKKYLEEINETEKDLNNE